MAPGFYGQTDGLEMHGDLFKRHAAPGCIPGVYSLLDILKSTLAMSESLSLLQPYSLFHMHTRIHA